MTDTPQPAAGGDLPDEMIVEGTGQLTSEAMEFFRLATQHAAAPTHPVPQQPVGAREDVARLVYDAMCWAAQNAEKGEPPAWVAYGDSDAQGEARRVADQIAALSSQPEERGGLEGESVALMRPFWVSWWRAPGTFELHRPWWISGERDDGAQSMCAAVLAQDEFTARLCVQWAHDNKDTVIEWRFVEPKDRGWSPFSSRFRRADWMIWPDCAALTPASTGSDK
jgi:hypothetical protein